MKKNVNSNNFCSSSRTNITECAYKSWAGNGYCDDPVNTAECGYDLGDCCPKETSDTKWKTYCKECLCKQL